MSAITDRNDQDTLAFIGRNPGVKRSSTWVTKASVMRLIREGLITPPSTNGKLFLTENGTRLHLAIAEHQAAIRADGGHAGWCAGPYAHLAAPAQAGDH